MRRKNGAGSFEPYYTKRENHRASCPNGSGKTTLIKLINGLLTATEGEILINGSRPGPESKSVVSYLPERTYFRIA